MQDLDITLVQTQLFWEDPEANINHFSHLLSDQTEKTDVIILPEMFNTGFTMEAAFNAESMGGMSMKWMAQVASQKDCVVCGSLIIEEGKHYYNRFIWMRPDGSFDQYDKKHLFRMGDEHQHYNAGTKKIICKVKGWKVMPLICYDLRFPVWSKNNYDNDEYAYDLLIYVANWPAVRIDAWTSLLKGRAVENMAYVAGVNRIGTDGRGYEYAGGSIVTSPHGKVIADTRPAQESVVTVSLNASELHDIRNKLGVGKDWDSFSLNTDI